jgi:hypothetical protein
VCLAMSGLRCLRPSDIKLLCELHLCICDGVPWMGDRPVGRPLPTQENGDTQESVTCLDAAS